MAGPAVGGKGAGIAGPAVGGRVMAAAAARARVSAFWAALRASGAAARLELTPPLYGSVYLTCACL